MIAEDIAAIKKNLLNIYIVGMCFSQCHRVSVLIAPRTLRHAEKMQLMEGKPIAMYSIDVTHRLETMMPKFLEEARRRGITVDAAPSEKLIEDAKA